MRNFALVPLLAAAVLACGDRRPDPGAPGAQAPAPDSTQIDSSMAIVARAASVAISMDAPNADADSVLAGAGITISEYESLMYRVAADTALTRLFLDAIEKR